MTSLFNNAAFEISAVAVEAPVTDKAVRAGQEAGQNEKRSWLPLLTVLFLISYALMTMLIVEQGQTIESQRALIRELFRDSTELSSLRHAQMATASQTSQMPAAKTPSVRTPAIQIPSTQTQSSQIQSNQSQSSQIPSNQTPSNQTPSNQAPSNQAPSNQALTKAAPSSQAMPQQQAQKRGKKPEFKMPSRPASDLTDENRALITI